MPSKKKQFHLYLDEGLYDMLVSIAPGYGAASKLVQQLIAEYLNKKATAVHNGNTTKVQ